jgi:hypothetical protein
MALSEREQRLLEEMERNLYNNEADVVTTLGVSRTPNFRAMAIGAIVALGGLITMLLGVNSDLTVVGIVGFAIMFTGVMVAVAIPGESADGRSGSTMPTSTSGSGGSFMNQMNERWERRNNGEPL